MRALPTEAEVRAALNEIIDPCSVAAGTPGGLDDLGLIRRVKIDAAAEPPVRVVIGVTEYGCVMGAPFAVEAYKILEPMFGPGRVRVELDAEFDWLPEDMAPGYRARLAAAHTEGRRRLAPAAASLPLLTIEPRGGGCGAGRTPVG